VGPVEGGEGGRVSPPYQLDQFAVSPASQPAFTSPPGNRW
jgi:hypothetical protein